MRFNRYYTEIAEDYWNKEYLDYSPRLDNIILTIATRCDPWMVLIKPENIPYVTDALWMKVIKSPNKNIRAICDECKFETVDFLKAEEYWNKVHNHW